MHLGGSSSAAGSLQCWCALLPDLNILGLGKSKVYHLIFQLSSKDLPTWLAHLQVLLCQVFAFFLTLILVSLIRLLEFSLQRLQQVLNFD